MKFISQAVVLALWLSLRSLPPKEAMVAFVVTAIFQFLAFSLCLMMVMVRMRERENLSGINLVRGSGA